ncbi:MAG: AcrR family transcriptional regulator [Hyphomicrobiaceae bacterium]|jgi:AcrR family transcriptional regulator
MPNHALAPPAFRAPLEWVKPPRQARTHATLEKLLDTAELMLATRAFDDISISELAAEAGSSVGAFYRRFKDKDGLLHALQERYASEALVTADAALDPNRWEGTGIAEIVHECLAFLTQALTDRRGLDRAVFIRSLTDEAFREHSSRVSLHVMHGMADLLLARRDEITHPNPDVAVDVGLRQALCFIGDTCTVNGRDLALTDLDNDQVSRETAHSFLAYLGVRNPAATD